MAQFVMQDMISKEGLQDFFDESKATSTEEIGNSPHPGTVSKLRQQNIPLLPHKASQMTKADYNLYDYIIGMDRWNFQNIMKIVKTDPENKVHLLLDFTKSPGDIADPWYTGNFDKTFEDVFNGCSALLEILKKKNEK